MEKDTNDIEKEIRELEERMQLPDFWNDKNKAQGILKELSELKAKKEGLGKYDRGNAVLTIVSGAGGDDAEDFSAILLAMYMKYAMRKNWNVALIHEHKNDHNGYRNVSFEISGNPSTMSSGRSGPYGTLRKESGVHRL